MACLLLFQARKAMIGISFHNESPLFLDLAKPFVMIDDRKIGIHSPFTLFYVRIISAEL